MELLEKVEQCGKWPQQACTTMFFLIPKNVMCARPIVLMPTLIRWWDGRNGGGQQTVLEILLEMERFKYRAGEEELGVVDLLLGLGNALKFPKEDTASAVRVFFEHQRRVRFEGCAAETLQTITAILPRSKWSCLLLRVVMAECIEVTKIFNFR